MNDLGKIILYLVATVILGALMAAPLYWGAQILVEHGIQTWLGEQPFRRFFHRGLLIAAVLLLWPTAKWLAVPNVQALGLRRNPHRWSDLAFGFAASFLMMVVLGFLLVWFDIYRLRAGKLGLDILGPALVQVMISAITVSLLEEGLFRGGIQGLSQRTMGWVPTLFWVSALYSILHFLKPQQELPPGHVINWFSGFVMIPGAFAQFQQPWLLLGGFTTLFLVGWILGWARLRTGSLWLPIGLHAGWIFGTMGYSKMARQRKGDYLPWIGENLAVGLVAVISVLLTGALVWWWVRRRHGQVSSHEQDAATVA